MTAKRSNLADFMDPSLSGQKRLATCFDEADAKPICAAAAAD
jgi:hypothetical protein